MTAPDPWFRFYIEALNDPKVQRLPAPLFKSWVNMLCIAKQNDGNLPPIEEIAYALRLSEAITSDIVQKLILRNLIDIDPMGKMAPHEWGTRQYKSDTSADRTRKYRMKKHLHLVPKTPE